MKPNLLILLLLLGSCTAEKQLQRALKRNPELLKSDTIYKRDTIYSKEVYKDSIFRFTSDTVVLQKERLTVKYFHNYHDSTVYLEGNCAPDTIVVETPQVTNTIIQDPTWWINVKQYWWIVLLIAVILTLIGILKKVKVW